jgi:signal transduction histidine kinase/ligand-binding sensor domain-containing protein
VETASRRRILIIALAIVLGYGIRAFALNPTLDVSQYAHTAWKVSDGFFSGIIFSIAQTPDGYLWIGTDSGLFRFDGVRSVPWHPPAGSRLPGSDIRTLRAARDGRLWIGTARGLASLKDGRLTAYPELDGHFIEALLEDREGKIWVGSWGLPVGRLCTIQSSKTECYGEDGRFGSGVTALYEDSGGDLWAGTMTGLWRWKPGPPKVYPMPDSANRVNALIETDDGGILVTKDTGIAKLKNGKTETVPLPAGLEFQPGELLRDRHGALWIGAMVDSGLLHIHGGRSDLFTRSDGLSGNTIPALIEDREGSIWVATVDGVDRFRDVAVPRMSIQQGLSSDAVLSLVATKDGSIWLGTDTGLNRWKDGEITVYRRPRRRGSVRGGAPAAVVTARRQAVLPGFREIADDALPADSVDCVFEDSRGRIWVATNDGAAILGSGRFHPVRSVPPGITFSIAEDRAGSVWFSHQEGLLRLESARVIQRIPWATLGRKEPAISLLRNDAGDGLWLGFRGGGVAHFTQGRVVTTYETPQGVGALHTDPHGTLWAATEAGLSRVEDARALTLTRDNGLPCDTVHWMMEDDAASVWLSTACGLLRIAQSEFDAWASKRTSTVHATVFDRADGVGTHQFHYGYSPIVTKSAGGKLWYTFFGGLSVIDPHHLPVNPLPPPVHIEQITADGRTYDASDGLRLPAGVRDLSVEFTALSLAVPEKVRFRVKLEGQDQDWRELVNQRHVEYTNLAPRTYRLRVLAANNSAVWNEDGAALEFAIPPLWYQTNWAHALAGAMVVAVMWAAYRLRVRQLAHQFTLTLDARVGERTRIARELHDTLLQSFQGLLLRFQTASYLLLEHPADAKEKLDGAIEHAAKAITEGRDAVQSLRASTVERNDLAAAIRTLGDELTSDPSAHEPLTYSVAVEGETRDLHPIARDEIYKVAAEALRNAYRHAHASRVEVEIRYDKQQFRLRVRDDGRGIDPRVLGGQTIEGHYGLRGMPERAGLIGGKVAVRSEAGAGTEVEMSIPARAVYATAAARSWWSRVFGSKMRGPVERDRS